MGVLRESSSRLMLAKSGVVAECTMGDLSSEGYVPDRGVLRVDRTGLASVAAMISKCAFC
jgi:hypothetical protein